MLAFRQFSPCGFADEFITAIKADIVFMMAENSRILNAHFKRPLKFNYGPEVSAIAWKDFAGKLGPKG